MNLPCGPDKNDESSEIRINSLKSTYRSGKSNLELFQCIYIRYSVNRYQYFDYMEHFIFLPTSLLHQFTLVLLNYLNCDVQCTPAGLLQRHIILFLFRKSYTKKLKLFSRKRRKIGEKVDFN